MSDESPSKDGVPNPHSGQQRVLDLPGRYRVAICGRRFGKTVAAAIAAVRKCEGAPSDKPQRVWWISPVQDQSDRVERDVVSWLAARLKRQSANPSPPRGEGGASAPGEGATERSTSPSSRVRDAHVGLLPAGEKDAGLLSWDHRKSEHALVCANGSRLEFHSAQLPDNLRGAGLDLVIVDEAADVTEYAWKTVLKPMLLDRRGEAIILGTPRGTQHWLHRIFLLGQDPERAETYSSIRLPTSASPLIDPAELEAFRAEMTAEEFKQEFEAEFVDGVGALFRKVSEAVQGEALNAGRRGERYFTGIDLGRKEDFTVLCSIARQTQRLEGFARFNIFDWKDQLLRIADHLRRFPGPCLVDCSGVGDALYEDIRAFHRDAREFLFTLESRNRIIHRLAVDLEHGRLKLANIPELVGELHTFAALKKEGEPNLRVHYGAPAGMHDDCVMSLALAWWAYHEECAKCDGNGMTGGLFG